MLIQNIALVPEAGGVNPSELLRVSAALQKQIGSHFGPCWEVQATVDPFLELEQVPAGYVPVVLSEPEHVERAIEISLDPSGQPFARVGLGAGWSVAASRACLELLINPFGQRTISANSPRSDQGPAEILVEACGALGELHTAYAVNDVAVSDFCLPSFFRPAAVRSGESYSFRGALSAPLQLLRGGHVAWFDPISNSWWVRSFHDEHPSDRSLGVLHARGRPLRTLIQRHEPVVAGSALSHEPLDARVRWQWMREQATAAAVARAQRLRQTLGLPHGVTQYEDEEDEEETVAMALAAPRREPVHTPTLISSPPPPLPERYGESEGHRYEDKGAERSSLIVTAHDVRSGSVVIAASEIPSSGAVVQRRDTLPLTPLLPPAPQAVSLAQEALASSPAPTVSEARSVNASVQASGAPAAAAATARATGSVSASHSSIAPIAMLADPPRDASPIGMMVAAAGAAALLTVAIMSTGTRSAAHGVQVANPKPAASEVTAKPDAGKQAPEPGASVPVPSPVVSASVPLPAPSKVERSVSPDAQRAREEARERRRQKEQEEREQRAAAPAPEAESPSERTAAIENLFDTRR